MRRLVLRMMLVPAVLATVLLPAQAAHADFSDVSTSYWDYTQIKYVAITNTWMQDFGSSQFQPRTQESRNLLARAMVKAFAPDDPVDPSITFPDLPSSDPFYPYANVAYKHGWIDLNGGKWKGDGIAKASLVDQAIVLALGLNDPVKGLANIHEADGDAYKVGDRWPHVQLARTLGLHYNHSDESMDINSDTYITRDEVAYSLWRAKTLQSWEIDATSKFDDVSLAALDLTKPDHYVKRELTQFALNQVGFPYIWAGEWNAASPSGYCCGTQPQGGFDCSGFTWFVEKKNEDGYNAAQFHPNYPGWVLHERSSSTMAQATKTQVKYKGLKVGYLMFFASNGGTSWSDVDHVGIWIGRGWMIHSTDGGPQLELVSSGWYRDHFVFGRALATTAPATEKASPKELLAGDEPVGP